jgi:DNA-binding response OmpR family regulator
MGNLRVLLIDAGKAPSMPRGTNDGRGEQFHFTHKPTLFEGLHVLRELRFDLVLLALSLPDASASESVTKVRKESGDLPLIALVSEDDATKAAQALRLGIDDYFVKGCGSDSLVHTMLHALERKRLLADKGQALQCVTETKAHLTRHLSHEVRNALACIHQFGTLMIDGLAGSVSDEQREYLCIMLENASTIRSVLDAALEGTYVPESYP